MGSNQGILDRDAALAANRLHADENPEDPPDLMEWEQSDVDDFQKSCISQVKKYGNAVSLDALLKCVPDDYSWVINERVRTFRRHGEKAASAKATVDRLEAHKRRNTWPTSFNSISVPTLQFMDEFRSNEEVRTFNETANGVISQTKRDLLEATITAKRAEYAYYLALVNITPVVQAASHDVKRRHADIVRLAFPPGADGRLTAEISGVRAGLEAEREMVMQTLPSFFARILALIRASEDARLAKSLEKMDLSAKAKDKAKGAKDDPSAAKFENISKQLQRLSSQVSLNFLPVVVAFANRDESFNFLAWIQETWRIVTKEGRTSQEKRTRQSGKGYVYGRSAEESAGRPAGRFQEPEEERQGTERFQASLQGTRWREAQGQGLWEVVASSTTVPGVDVRHERYDILFDIYLVLTTSFNFFDGDSYPDSLLYIYHVDPFLTFELLFLLAPSNLLGRLRFRNNIHVLEGLVVPQEVSDVLSAGARYLPPAYYEEKRVSTAWNNLIPIIKRDFGIWINTDFGTRQLEEARGDCYLSISFPYLSKGVPEIEGGDATLLEALDLGRLELLRQTHKAPKVTEERRMQNIRPDEALTWCRENRVLVKQTDKNLGTVAVSASWYERKVKDFLTGIPFFEEISEFEAHTSVANTCNRVTILSKLPCAVDTPRLSHYLMHRIEVEDDEATNTRDKGFKTCVNMPVFSALPKIHKKIWAIRPIIPCYGVPQGPASEILSIILKEMYAKCDSILISSKQLVIEIEKLNSTILKQAGVFSSQGTMDQYFFATGDVSGFYTNVDTVLAKDIVIGMIRQHFEKELQHPRWWEFVVFVAALYDAQQDDLVFKAMIEGVWSYWKQTRGLAMGVPAAPDVANLFAAFFEHMEAFRSFRKLRCLFYGRYIDDIFVIIRARSREHAETLLRENVKFPELEINWEVSDTHCVFLDLDLQFTKRWPDLKVTYKPYRKPMNNFERLPYITGHSEKMLKAAFKSEVYRIAVLSCDEETFESELTWLRELYFSRGYPAKVVLGWTTRFKADAWSCRLRFRKGSALVDSETAGIVQNTLTTAIWPLKSDINPVWENLVLAKVIEEMREPLDDYFDADKVDRFIKRLVASQSRPRNLGDAANSLNKTILNIKASDTMVNLRSDNKRAWRVRVEDWDSPASEESGNQSDMDIEDITEAGM